MTAALAVLDGALGRLRRDPRRTWWAVFALLVLAGTCWALASPLYSGPDEKWHTLRAVSLVRGQVLGEDAGTAEHNMLEVRVPGVYGSGNDSCFAFQPAVTADCKVWQHDLGEQVHVTSAARHPPAYYVLAGLPSLVAETSWSIYLMRLMGVVACAALVASAVRTLAELDDARTAGLGMVVALTPMTLFVFGLVNPSSVEIAGAVGVWVSGYVLARAAPRVIDPRVVARFAVAASVLVLSRALAPLWLAGIVVILALAASPGALGAAMRDRTCRRWAAVVGAATAAQAAWIVLARPLGVVDEASQVDAGFTTIFAQSFGKSFDRGILEMIGVFGWLDTAPPAATYALWFAMLGVVVLLGLAVADRRQAIALGLLTAAVIVVPVLLETLQAPRAGYVWQGRYTMPIALGVPLLAGMMAAGARTRMLLSGTRLYALVGVLFVVAHVLAFAQALRRYSVGHRGELLFFTDPSWSPPLGHLPLLVLYALVVSGIAWVLLAAGATGRDVATEDGAEPSEAGEVAADDPEVEGNAAERTGAAASGSP